MGQPVHVCAQCNGTPDGLEQPYKPDGTEQPYPDQGAPVWLHKECHRFWFAEIFGVEPDSDDTIEATALPDILIEDVEEWAAIREEYVVERDKDFEVEFR